MMNADGIFTELCALYNTLIAEQRILYTKLIESERSNIVLAKTIEANILEAKTRESLHSACGEYSAKVNQQHTQCHRLAGRIVDRHL
jgi:hypothetical protein